MEKKLYPDLIFVPFIIHTTINQKMSAHLHVSERSVSDRMFKYGTLHI